MWIGERVLEVDTVLLLSVRWVSTVQSAFRDRYIVYGGHLCLHYLGRMINARDVHANFAKFLILLVMKKRLGFYLMFRYSVG